MTRSASFGGQGRIFLSYKLHMHITISNTLYLVIPTPLSSANASTAGLYNFISAIVTIATI